MAERIVAYKIKVVQDGANANQLNAFAKKVIDTERKIAIEREGINSRADDNIATNRDRMLASMEASHKASVGRMGKDVDAAAKRAADAAINSAKRVEGALAGSATRLSATLSKATGAMQVSVGQSAAAAIADVEKSSKASSESSKKTSDDAGAAAQRAAEKARKEFESLDSKLDDLEGKIKESGREIRGRFEEWAGGVMQFGRGIASIGLVSQDSTEKLVRGLVAAQGAFDTVIGGIKVYQELKRVVEAYNAAQLLASQAQATASARNIAAIEAEVLATNALAASRGRAAVAGTASQAAGAARSVPAGAVGGRIGSAIGGVGRFGGAVGGAITTGGTAVAAKVGAAGIGAGAAGLAAAGLAALASSAFALVSSFKTAGAALESGIGGGAQEGSFVDTVGGSDWNPFSWLIAWSEKSEAQAKQATTERMQLEREANKLLIQRNRDLAALQANQLTQQLDNRLNDNLVFGDETAEQRLAINQRNLTAVQSSASGIIESATESSEAEGLAARRDMMQRELELQREQLQLQKEIGQEKLNAARQSLDASQKELQITQQALQADQDRLLSAKERFGQLSEIEQQRLIGIKSRADAGEELTREERALLRGVGTEDATNIARQGDLAAADAAGFDATFGQVERDRIAANEQLQSQLEAQVQVQQDVIVKIEQDTDAVVNQVKDQLQALQQELYPVVEQIIQAEVAAAREEIRKQFEARQSQLPRSGGRR